MISRLKTAFALFAATLFTTACIHTGTAPAKSAMQPLAATHQPKETQAVIVIPEDWRATYPFSRRFPVLAPASEEGPRHVIDLAAMRFETDSLVSVAPDGQRTFAMPDLSSFAGPLRSSPFRGAEEDYFIVQAKDPKNQTALRDLLEHSSIAILDYLPQLAYLIRVSEKQVTALQQRPEVFWIGHYSPAFRVDPLLDYVIESNASQHIQMRLVFDVAEHADVEPLLQRLRGLGLAEGKRARRSRDWTIRVSGSAIRARDAALIEGCLWVERYVDPGLDNNVARTSQSVLTGRGASSGPIMDVEDVWARGIRGEGQIASAADTGLSTGNLATLHQDFGQSGSGTNPLRVIAGYALGRASWNDDQNVDGGHGTHTSGSIVGNGFRSGADPSTNTFPTTSYAGTAPKAQFVFQSIMDSNGGLGGLPADLNTLFQQTYNAGARVHSNSWGAAVNGIYTTDSQEVDQFAWRNKDMVITFSAGNSGTDGSSPIDGIINRDSIGAPGTAKNCITVGASENYVPGFIYETPANDCTSSNGVEQKTWGWYSSLRWGTNPLFSDLIADNANGIAPFSSRGPTDDGRFKPDLVAPGTAITSTRTDLNQAYEPWGICSIPVGLRPYYVTMGGTSMSNPLTAGVATLVRQYYADGWHANDSAVTNASPVPAQGFNPSSALVKATLINGAWDMNPGQYGTGTTQEIVPGWDTGATLPNNAEGFGRVDAEKSLFPGSGFGDAANKRMQVHDVTPGLTTGAFRDFTFNIGNSANPLIVTLVWTDPQAASGSGIKLVNNLDLTVIAPGGATTYFPNGVNKTAGADSLNNVEQVKVTSPAAGLWTIRVTGTNVPGNAESGSTTQPYAVVISGVSCSNAPSIPSGVTATAGPNKITVNWTASTGSPVSYQVYRAGPAAACPALGYSLIATVNAPAVTYDDLTTSGSYHYSYRVVSVGATCESEASSCASATSGGACIFAPVFAGLASVTPPSAGACALNLAWAAAVPNCAGPITYNVYRSTSSGFTPGPTNRIATGISGLTYSDVNAVPGSTYYYNVRAVQNGLEETNGVERSAAAVTQTTLYTQNFDALPAGNLAGFTLSGTGTADWRGVMACSPNQSSPNVFRFGGTSCTANYVNNSTAALATLNGASGLAVPAGAGNVRLSFWHRWDFESFYDGGQIRIRRSTDGSYTTVPASAILAGSYNGTAIQSQTVWTGTSTSMTNSVINLDAACNAIAGNTGGCAGKTIFIAFTAITDSSVTLDGWFIDNVQVTYETACAACTPPGTPTGLVLTTPASNTIRLTWATGAPAGVSYNIYREAGSCPMSTPRLIASGITATTYDDPGRAGGTTHRYVVRAVSAGGCESGSSNCQSGAATGPALAVPPNFAALGASSTSAYISWRPVAGATHYVVERSANGSTFTQVAVTPGTAMADNGLALATSYLYRAYARDGGGALSTATDRDLATTVVFTNEPLTAGVLIQAAHLDQLRSAVNAARVLAGLGAGTYTDPTITPFATTIKRLHISELRTNLDAARSVLLLPAVSYTDPTLTTSTPAKAVHVQDLRNGAN